MYIATELICITLEIFMIIFYLSYSFDIKPRTVPFIVINVIYFLGLTILSFMENMSFARLFFTFFIIAVMAICLYNSGTFKGLLYSFIYCTFIIVADVITSIVFLIAGIDAEQMLELGSGRSLFIIIAHIVLFISFLILMSIRPLLNIPYSFKEFLCVLPCIVFTGLLCYILTTQFILKGLEIPILYIVVLIGMLYNNVFFLYFIHSIHHKEREKQEYELSNQHFLMQQNYYEQLHNQQESVRALWHDINKYILASNIDSSSSLSELQHQLDEIKSTIDTNNKTINVILNEYMYQAKELDVVLDFDINVPDILPMLATELYIVLGNSFDNALEAISYVAPSNRYITMKLKYQNNILYYELSNPYVKGVSRSKFKKIHGYGIKNIQKIADKYTGVVITQKTDSTFNISCHFNF